MPAELAESLFVVYPGSPDGELYERQDHDHNKQSNSNRRRIAHLEQLKCVLVDVHDQTTAGITRAALGQYNDRVKHLQRAII